MKVAIFDFDGTIYQNETFNLFMKHMKEHPKFSVRYNQFYASILFPFICYKAKLYPEGKMKDNLMKKYLNALAGFTEAEIRAFFDEAAVFMKNSFNSEVVNRLKQHAENGYYTMIVSGAYTPVLETAVTHLPVDKIIGTDIPFTNDTFEKNSPVYHIQSIRKKVVVQDFLHGKTIDWANSYAYGDSYSDLYVLNMVGNPVAVDPDELLERVALRHDWEVID